MEKNAETNQADSEKLNNPEFSEEAQAKEEEAIKEGMASEEAASGPKEKEPAASSSSASTDESNGGSTDEDSGLSAKDVKRIKQLFNEQEAEIKSLEKTIKAKENKIEEMKKN